MSFKVPEAYRYTDTRSQFGTERGSGNYGIFYVPHPSIKDYRFQVMATDGAAAEGEVKWEHVSICLMKKHAFVKRCPTWDDMCYIKDMFWGKEDRVVQYHPPESEYVHSAGGNKWILHLWRPVGFEIVHPPSILAGQTDKQKK